MRKSFSINTRLFQVIGVIFVLLDWKKQQTCAAASNEFLNTAENHEQFEKLSGLVLLAPRMEDQTQQASNTFRSELDDFAALIQKRQVQIPYQNPSLLPRPLSPVLPNTRQGSTTRFVVPNAVSTDNPALNFLEDEQSEFEEQRAPIRNNNVVKLRNFYPLPFKAGEIQRRFQLLKPRNPQQNGFQFQSQQQPELLSQNNPFGFNQGQNQQFQNNNPFASNQDQNQQFQNNNQFGFGQSQNQQFQNNPFISNQDQNQQFQQNNPFVSNLGSQNQQFQLNDPFIPNQNQNQQFQQTNPFISNLGNQNQNQQFQNNPLIPNQDQNQQFQTNNPFIFNRGQNQPLNSNVQLNTNFPIYAPNVQSYLQNNSDFQNQYPTWNGPPPFFNLGQPILPLTLPQVLPSGGSLNTNKNNDSPFRVVPKTPPLYQEQHRHLLLPIGYHYHYNHHLPLALPPLLSSNLNPPPLVPQRGPEGYINYFNSGPAQLNQDYQQLPTPTPTTYNFYGQRPPTPTPPSYSYDNQQSTTPAPPNYDYYGQQQLTNTDDNNNYSTQKLNTPAPPNYDYYGQQQQTTPAPPIYNNNGLQNQIQPQLPFAYADNEDLVTSERQANLFNAQPLGYHDNDLRNTIQTFQPLFLKANDQRQLMGLYHRLVVQLNNDDDIREISTVQNRGQQPQFVDERQLPKYLIIERTPTVNVPLVQL